VSSKSVPRRSGITSITSIRSLARTTDSRPLRTPSVGN
jgi:hypothetical protein